MKSMYDNTLGIQLFFNCVLFALLANFCTMHAGSQPRQNVINEIIHKKNELGGDTTFLFFDLQLSVEEQKVLESLQIKTAVPFRIFGNPEHKEHEIALYLQSLGNNLELAERAASIIYRFIIEIFDACGFPAALVVLRPTERTDTFEVPRWHFDSVPNPVLQDMKLKIACALQGP